MQIWNEFLRRKEQLLGKATVKKWLFPFKVLNYDAANLYLEAQDTFQAQWFDEYVRPTLKDELVNENHRPIKVHVQIKNHQGVKPKAPLHPSKAETYQPIIDPLDPAFVLDHFVFNEQNKILQKLLSSFKNFSLAQTPIYNPIYIYGAKGLGKTHLLQSAYHLFKEEGLKVVYVSLLTFMNNMVKAMKDSKMPYFRKFYRDVDVLIVDDIHHLSHKNATQEEFFHTFNALHIEGKQILLSSNCSPQQLKAVEPRLMSRFEWGIVLPLNTPKEKDLKLILDNKIKQLNFPIGQHAKDFLIKRFSKNPFVLQKALSALILRAHLRLPQGKKLKSSYLSTESMELLLADLLKEQEKEKVTEERILDKVAHYFGIRRQDILGKSQSRECAWPRQVCMYFFRDLLQMPYTQIGRYFGRDHSTVISSVKQVEKNLIHPDQEEAKVIHLLKDSILPSSEKAII